MRWHHYSAKITQDPIIYRSTELNDTRTSSKTTTTTSKVTLSYSDLIKQILLLKVLRVDCRRRDYAREFYVFRKRDQIRVSLREKKKKCSRWSKDKSLLIPWSWIQSARTYSREIYWYRSADRFSRWGLYYDATHWRDDLHDIESYNDEILRRDYYRRTSFNSRSSVSVYDRIVFDMWNCRWMDGYKGGKRVKLCPIPLDQ